MYFTFFLQTIVDPSGTRTHASHAAGHRTGGRNSLDKTFVSILSFEMERQRRVGTTGDRDAQGHRYALRWEREQVASRSWDLPGASIAR
jgi:hypothetical protein